MLAVGADRLGAAVDVPARNIPLVQGEACCLPAYSGAFDFALVGGSGSFNHLDAADASGQETHCSRSELHQLLPSTRHKLLTKAKP